MAAANNDYIVGTDPPFFLSSLLPFSPSSALHGPRLPLSLSFSLPLLLLSISLSLSRRRYGDPYVVAFDEQNLLGLGASFFSLIYVLLSLASKNPPVTLSKKDGIVLLLLYVRQLRPYFARYFGLMFSAL